MAFCPNCGSEVASDYKSCPACGAKLATGVAPIKIGKSINELTIEEKTKPKTMKQEPRVSDVLNIIFGLIGLVVIFVGGYFLLTLIPHVPEQRGYASIAEVKDLISTMTKAGLGIVAAGALVGFLIGLGVKGVIQASQQNKP